MDKIQDISENLRFEYPVMPDITIATNGVLKLLGNLKKDKASGLDNIKPVVLKELRNEIAPVGKLYLKNPAPKGLENS